MRFFNHLNNAVFSGIFFATDKCDLLSRSFSSISLYVFLQTVVAESGSSETNPKVNTS